MSSTEMDTVPEFEISTVLSEKVLNEVSRLAAALENKKINAAAYDAAMTTLWNLSAGLTKFDIAELFREAPKPLPDGSDCEMRTLYTATQSVALGRRWGGDVVEMSVNGKLAKTWQANNSKEAHEKLHDVAHLLELRGFKPL